MKTVFKDASGIVLGDVQSRHIEFLIVAMANSEHGHDYLRLWMSRSRSTMAQLEFKLPTFPSFVRCHVQTE